VVTDEQVGDAIRRTREAAGLSQARLADRMIEAGMEGATTFLISRVEMGQRPCRATELVAFARGLGTTPEALLYAASVDALTLSVDAAKASRAALHQAVLDFVFATDRALTAFDALDDEERFDQGVRDLDRLIAAIAEPGKVSYSAVYPEHLDAVRSVLDQTLVAIEVVEMDPDA
jgi:hypothetical protein